MGNYLYVDINGRPVRRDPLRYPYSYDPYVIYKAKDFNPKTDSGVYSDRVTNLFYSEQEISEARRQVTNDPYRNISWRNPEQVSKFMTILMKKSVRCTAIIQECNWSNGYPYWYVYLR